MWSLKQLNFLLNVNNNFQQMHFSYIYYIFQSYYIQHFTYHNNIIEEQTCAKRNPLFQLVYSTQAPQHTPDPQPQQS
jgi:hypothetical protein